MTTDPLDFNIDFGIGAGPTSQTFTKRPSKPSHVYPPRRLLTQIPSTDEYVLHIDNSSLERFTTCARAAEYYLVYSKETAHLRAALGFGKAIHSALELRGLVEGDSSPEVLAAIEQRQIEVIINHFENHFVPDTEFRTCERAIQVIQKYNKQYGHELFTFERDANGNPYVEVPFTIPLGDLAVASEIPYPKRQLVVDATEDTNFTISVLHIVWTGRIDALIRQDGQLWVMDHKTSSIMGQGFFDDFHLNNATLGYCWAAQKIVGEPVVGLLMNAIGVRAPSKTGNMNQFERQRYLYTPDRISEWELNTQALVADFVSNLIRGYFPMETKWCIGKYGKCEYWDTCTLPKHQRTMDLFGSSYQDVTWSPLNE